MGDAERGFALSLDQAGKLWFFQPKAFILQAPYYSYQPDFYVVDVSTFYEVCGSRQAYSYQREKIECFRKTYPNLKLEVINGGAWLNGPVGPRKDRIIPSYSLKRTKALVRLANNGSRYGERLAEMAQALDCRSISALCRELGLTDLDVRAIAYIPKPIDKIELLFQAAISHKKEAP